MVDKDVEQLLRTVATAFVFLVAAVILIRPLVKKINNGTVPAAMGDPKSPSK